MKQRPNVLDLTERRRRRGPKAGAAPGRGGGQPLSQGSLALQSEVKPKPRPTPGRWYGEAHHFLGFRLWDVVYIFAIARQAGLSTEEGLGWGMRYWAGGLSPEQDLTIIALLTPDADAPESPVGRRQALDAGFIAAILQGAEQLLGERYEDEIPVEEAARLQWLLEGLYAREGWRLPALPFALQLLLRKAKERPDGF